MEKQYFTQQQDGLPHRPSAGGEPALRRLWPHILAPVQGGLPDGRGMNSSKASWNQDDHSFCSHKPVLLASLGCWPLLLPYIPHPDVLGPCWDLRAKTQCLSGWHPPAVGMAMGSGSRGHGFCPGSSQYYLAEQLEQGIQPSVP